MLKRHDRPSLQVKRFPKQLSLCMSLISCTLFSLPSFAQTFSYSQAEQYVVQNAYSSQAQQALQQASQLEMEAVKNLGLPRIDLNARAYAFHSETSVPLESSKRRLENSLTNGLMKNYLNGKMYYLQKSSIRSAKVLIKLLAMV
jgi:hypothetical protein